jgi:hypothetical protein
MPLDVTRVTEVTIFRRPLPIGHGRFRQSNLLLQAAASLDAYLSRASGLRRKTRCL